MPVFFLSLPGLRSGASRLSGPRGGRCRACVWMSLHTFVSLPPCRLFIISASSFSLRLGSPALSDAFSLPLPLFPRIFFLLAFPCLPTRLPLHLLRTFPRCLLIFLAPFFFLPSQPPPASSSLRFPSPSPCRLYIYPCVLSSSLSHALREQSPRYDSGLIP